MKSPIPRLIISLCLLVMTISAHRLEWYTTAIFCGALTGSGCTLTLFVWVGRKVQARHEANMVGFIKSLQKNLDRNAKS